MRGPIQAFDSSSAEYEVSKHGAVHRSSSLIGGGGEANHQIYSTESMSPRADTPRAFRFPGTPPRSAAAVTKAPLVASAGADSRPFFPPTTPFYSNTLLRARRANLIISYRLLTLVTRCSVPTRRSKRIARMQATEVLFCYSSHRRLLCCFLF